MDDEREPETEDGPDDGDASGRYAHACACFCRGALALDATTPDDDAIAQGRAAGLRLHRFKRARPLPRVQRVIATLLGLAPTSLLDVGTGRGVLLWPLLEAFPHVPVTCVDMREDRVQDLQSTARGGLVSLDAMRASVQALPHEAKRFDVSICAEVLEHVEDERAAVRELVRVTRRFVIVTVPSQPDENPEHVRLFSARSLERLFLDAGASRVNVTGVRGHLFAVVSVGGPDARA